MAKWTLTDACAKRIALKLAVIMTEAGGLHYSAVIDCLNAEGFTQPASEVCSLMNKLRKHGDNTVLGKLAYRIGVCAADELHFRLIDLKRVREAVQTLTSFADDE